MKKLQLLLLFVSVVFSTIPLFAKQDPRIAKFDPERMGSSAKASAKHIQQSVPLNPLTPAVAITGAASIGLDGKYHSQFNSSGLINSAGLHNIAVDPGDPSKIHAVVAFARNLTEADTVLLNDSVAGPGFIPQLRLYYTFSADGGISWTSPKKVVDARTNAADLILYKRGEEYVPFIAAIRNIPNSSDSFYCALYIETGKPGDGTFAEVATERKDYEGTVRNISGPHIAASADGSKIYMAAVPARKVWQERQYVNFGTFTLSADKKSATWGGWKQGPNAVLKGNIDQFGYAYAGSAKIRVAPSGKIGVMWHNNDFGGSDLSMYLSESTDGGATWLSTPKAVMNSYATQVNISGVIYYLVPFGNDFWYSGELASAAMTGFYYNRDEVNGSYIPASGSLVYWQDPMTAPLLLLSRYTDTDLGTPKLDGTWISDWGNNGASSPQHATVTNPTVARTSNPNIFAIYFMAWQSGDVQDVGTIGTSGKTEYPYLGIYRTITKDGGATFREVDRIHTNDPSNAEEAKYDFQHIQTSAWNPESSGSVNVHTLFLADSLAGESVGGGNPGFNDASWFFQKQTFSKVRNTVDLTSSTRSYPNPTNGVTTISFVNEKTGALRLEMSDMLGRSVANTSYGIISAGAQKITFDASRLAAGSYRYTLRSGENTISGMMSVVK